jgi:hypothetical protein
MHPDHPHHYDIGVLTTDSTPPDFTFFAECKDIFEASINKHQDNPKSLTQARSHPDWSDWQDAMDRKIATLEQAGTWTTIS